MLASVVTARWHREHRAQCPTACADTESRDERGEDDLPIDWLLELELELELELALELELVLDGDRLLGNTDWMGLEAGRCADALGGCAARV